MSSASRVQAPATPGRPSSPFGSRLQGLSLLVIIAVVVAVRLIGLRSLQAEIYGDIAIVREYLDLIRQGQWPFHFALSSGPLYHYLVMPVIAVAGPGYFGMKLASVVVSLGVLAATFALSRRLHGDLLALLVALRARRLLLAARSSAASATRRSSSPSSRPPRSGSWSGS